MDAIIFFSVSIIIGVGVGLGVWFYRLTLHGLDDFYSWLNRKVIDPASHNIQDLIEKKELIKWKKDKLPELQERTRMGDKFALTERVVKSKHVLGDNDK